MTKNTLPDSRRIALQRALPILFFTFLFGVVLAILAWRGVRNAGDLSASSQEFTQYARVCEGLALPVATVFDRQVSVHPTVIFRETDTGWALDRTVIPEDALPANLGDVQLVLCVAQPEAITIPRCTGEQQPVVGAQLPLRLIAAKTGAIINRHTLGPQMPEAGCWPDDAAVTSSPTDADLWTWIAPFIDSNR